MALAVSVAWTYPVRVAQTVFAIILLGLTAYVVSWYDGNFLGSPSPANFMLFDAVWTLFIALAYLVLAPLYVEKITNAFVELAMEGVTMLFWFSGFISLAATLTFPRICTGSPCRSLQAAAVFGAFEWALFVATFADVLMGALNKHSRKSTKTPDAVAQAIVHAGV